MSYFLEGYYINLDDSLDRKDSLISHLQELGLENYYQRFAAPTLNSEEKKNLRGLKTLGELGIWKSYITLLDSISLEKALPDFVHIIEDDTRLNVSFYKILSSFLNMVHDDGNTGSVDIFFLDYFLDTSLFEKIAKRQNSNSQAYYEFLDSSFYLACLSSLLIRRSSVPLILKCLKKVFDSEAALLPIDLALRNVLRTGEVTALLLSPPVSSPGWNSSQVSTIQTSADPDLYRSMLAYILLRMCLSGIDSPQGCSSKLLSLFGQTVNLPDDTTNLEFLELFKSIEPQLIRF